MSELAHLYIQRALKSTGVERISKMKILAELQHGICYFWEYTADEGNLASPYIFTCDGISRRTPDVTLHTLHPRVVQHVEGLVQFVIHFAP